MRFDTLSANGKRQFKKKTCPNEDSTQHIAFKNDVKILKYSSFP